MSDKRKPVIIWEKDINGKRWMRTVYPYLELTDEQLRIAALEKKLQATITALSYVIVWHSDSLGTQQTNKLLEMLNNS